MMIGKKFTLRLAVGIYAETLTIISNTTQRTNAHLLCFRPSESFLYEQSHWIFSITLKEKNKEQNNDIITMLHDVGLQR